MKPSLNKTLQGPPSPSEAAGSETIPRIGITTYVETASWGVWSQPAALIPATYVEIVKSVGAAPVLLPPAPGMEGIVLDGVDALIVAGGPDVDPDLYGAERDPHTGPARQERDAWELSLLAAAKHRKLPVLAVCRGMQLLNVLYGGTLHQHVPDVVGGTGHQPAPATFGTTTVDINEGSNLHQILTAEVQVHCYHHQSLATVAPGLTVSGMAGDGTVEAVEDPSCPFMLAVQWHPEEDSTDLRLFKALKQAAISQITTNKGGAQHEQRP